MHIVRVANFVSPTSGGIKTALRHWGQIYRQRGHEVSLIIPGPGPAVEETEQGSIYRLPALPIPRRGYSLMINRRRLAALLEELTPDTLEVSDRVTTRWIGPWAKKRSIGSMMISHENVTGIMARRTPLPDAAAARVADGLNRASVQGYDMIVCPSDFAAEEFRRLDTEAVHVVPLGVDLETFVPSSEHDWVTPAGNPRAAGTLQVIHCGRLAPEKNPGLSIRATKVLVERGIDVQLTVLGHGPLRPKLLDAAADLPVTFHSYIKSRPALAAVMGRADVAIAPGPVETFGLAALEAMACGVPTVCPDEGALGEVVGSAGIAARSEPEVFADAVVDLAGRHDARSQARQQAETFSWEQSADRMLRLHAQLATR